MYGRIFRRVVVRLRTRRALERTVVDLYDALVAAEASLTCPSCGDRLRSP